MPAHKPLPLKQRTSSVDHRRDFSTDTWTSLLGLLKPREFLVTVDHFSIWRRHLAWAVEDGKELREYMTKRYASSMVFMSLLLSTELGVLFNSSGVTTDVRLALKAEAHGSLTFWVGMCIILSTILTILGLISTFTAWTMVSAVNDANAHCIFRSSIGQYAAELPGRFIVSSIYAFLAWVIMFFFILMPFGVYSNLLLLLAAVLFVHTIAAFSSFGRIIMHTGAMGGQRIFDPKYEVTLLPHTLHNNLLIKAKANLKNNVSIMRQYRKPVEPLRRQYSADELSEHLSERTNPTPPPVLQRKRTESLVKFADGFDTSGNRVPMPDTISIQPHGTPMSTLTADHPSSISRPPLRGNSLINSQNQQQRVSSPWNPDANSSDIVDPSPTQNVRKSIMAADNSALFAKWLSNENGGGQLSTVVEPSVDGTTSQNSSESFSAPIRRTGSYEGYARRTSPPEISRNNSGIPVPSQISSRSYSAVSALDDMEREALTDEERFDQEYGQIFEPYDNNDNEDENGDESVTTPRMGSSEQDHLLEQTERRQKMNSYGANNSYQTIPVPRLHR